MIPFASLKPMKKELDLKIREAFERVYNESNYIMGKEVENFGRNFAAYCGTKHCIACRNGLDALMISLKGLDVAKAMK